MIRAEHYEKVARASRYALLRDGRTGNERRCKFIFAGSATPDPAEAAGDPEEKQK